MVIVRAHMIEGRTEEQKRDFIAGLTDVTSRALSVPPEDIRVLVVELPRSNWGIAGRPMRAAAGTAAAGTAADGKSG